MTMTAAAVPDIRPPPRGCPSGATWGLRPTPTSGTRQVLRGSGAARGAAAHPERPAGLPDAYGGPAGVHRDAQASGLTLAEIGQVLAIRGAGQPPCEHATALIGQHLTQVESRITELQSARAALVELSRRAAITDPADCTEGICPFITGR